MINALAHVTRRFHPRGLHRLLKRIPWHGEEVITLNGVKVRVGSQYPVEWGAYWFGEYEPWVAQEIKKYLKPGDTAVDVGCNAGFHTCLMAKCGASVWAVDTDFLIRPRFWNNIGLNVDLTDLNHGIQITHPKHVKMDLFKRVHVGLIKVDVDGTEPQVLAEYDEVIQRDHPALIFEYTREHWDKIGWDLKRMRDWLWERNYEMKSISPPEKSWNFVTTDSDMLAVWFARKH